MQVLQQEKLSRFIYKFLESSQQFILKLAVALVTNRKVEYCDSWLCCVEKQHCTRMTYNTEDDILACEFQACPSKTREMLFRWPCRPRNKNSSRWTVYRLRAC